MLWFFFFVYAVVWAYWFVRFSFMHPEAVGRAALAAAIWPVMLPITLFKRLGR